MSIFNETGEEITPRKAELWLNLNYENQRPLRIHHVNFLAEEMRKGRFTPAATIHFCFLNGKTHLVNGQHTLHAIIKSGITQRLTVSRTKVDNPKELAQMYMTFDIGHKRTLRDAIISLSLDAVSGLSLEQLTKLCGACVFMEQGFIASTTMGQFKNRNKYSFQDQIDLAENWFYEEKRLYDVISPCSGRIRDRILKRSVMPVALVTLKYRPQEAQIFWKQVAQDDGLYLGDPRKSLHEWLLKFDDLGKESKEKNIVSPNAFSRAAAKCWNKWMMEEKLKTISIKDAREKISLVGIDDNVLDSHVGFLERSKAEYASTR